MIALVAVATITGICGFLAGQARGLRVERNRALRAAALFRHPSTRILRSCKDGDR